ncbi:hypothetical protein C8R44DRAFT_866439 [Mycena epipterygia]|nr:hypothetical protein C8R44DRAFT_866439 [Mycena epipterygia]
MQSRHASLSLLTSLAYLTTVFAGPIRNALYKHDTVLIGYHYVSQQKAAEYIKHGTLTNVGASSLQLGQGAYISLGINEWLVPDDYWQCAIFADESKFKNSFSCHLLQTPLI